MTHQETCKRLRFSRRSPKNSQPSADPSCTPISLYLIDSLSPGHSHLHWQTIRFLFTFVCSHTSHTTIQHRLVPLRSSSPADNLLLPHIRLPKCRHSPFSNSIVCRNTDNTAKIGISSVALTSRFVCKLQTI